jgi:hypothetical protein
MLREDRRGDFSSLSRDERYTGVPMCPEHSIALGGAIVDKKHWIRLGPGCEELYSPQ